MFTCRDVAILGTEGAEHPSLKLHLTHIKSTLKYTPSLYMRNAQPLYEKSLLHHFWYPIVHNYKISILIISNWCFDFIRTKGKLENYLFIALRCHVFSYININTEKENSHLSVICIVLKLIVLFFGWCLFIICSFHECISFFSF